ncbi:hypothetical protein [Clostridium cuniculi]|nr:hypothetical protein [Clostridium cuniculi]
MTKSQSNNKELILKFDFSPLETVTKFTNFSKDNDIAVKYIIGD